MTDTDFSSLYFLIVDDNISIQELVAHKLKKLGVVNIVTADNGKSALQKLQENRQPVDVIICDLNMPEMDGIQFLRYLAMQAYSGGIIILSGVNRNILRSAHRLAREHSLNILGSISKQFELNDIHNFIKQIDFNKRTPAKKSHFPVSKAELINAIDKQEMEYVFQPKVKISTRGITGVELLARWNHPNHGEILPEQFIHLAEQSGLIDRLTRLVCMRGIEQAGQWAGKGINIKLSINTTADSLARLDFTDFLVELIKKNNIHPGNIIIEVTETQLMENINAQLETLTRLSMSGIGLSIDDFGKGYSTLEQLERIPFTELKIDRDFVTGISGNAPLLAILGSTIDLARKLRIETVAEGVESQNDWVLVETMGCDYVQGFLVSRAMTADKFEKWYTARDGRY